MNMKEPDAFAEILENAKYPDGRCCFHRKDGYWDTETCRIYHVHGDPADANELRRVMRNTNQSVWGGSKFEVVIVMGTTKFDLPKRSEDLRMLTTYVLVHQIHNEVFGETEPLHVIGENNCDSTAVRAHAVTLKPSTKDLVNTQAICARGLVMALAFPNTKAAVMTMFDDALGNPALRMFAVGESMVPYGRATFADITRTIAEHPETAGTICIGVVTSDSGMIMAPAPSEEFDLKEGDVIAVIERDHVLMPESWRTSWPADGAATFGYGSCQDV